MIASFVGRLPVCVQDLWNGQVWNEDSQEFVSATLSERVSNCFNEAVEGSKPYLPVVGAAVGGYLVGSGLVGRTVKASYTFAAGSSSAVFAFVWPRVSSGAIALKDRVSSIDFKGYANVISNIALKAFAFLKENALKAWNTISEYGSVLKEKAYSMDYSFISSSVDAVKQFAFRLIGK